ncbi:aspartate/glutamate racemase family protein [uncultured Tateyamaria sp.]|uniref:aspartate/glutamate racemase family protein n=1 Tax=uncultured Tateyamaria sp. TaxID=455651 RepID=UPI0026016CA5|nr:aspartate/glutamate racemase family protein [uncultured Tateyamaria sp.]
MEPPAIGILMLDTAFERIHGDVGNPRTYPFPVRFDVVKGASTDEVVAKGDRARTILPAFLDGARRLEASGVRAITTSCGFLSVVQDEMAAALSVPFVASSLSLVPLVRQMVGGRPVGVITAHAGHLSERHFAASGIAPDWEVHLRGMEGVDAFYAPILGGANTLDADAVSRGLVDLCMALQRDVPDLAALVFECTNLQPYAHAVQAQTGLPVFGIYHLIQMLHDAACAPQFDGQV